MTSRCNNVLSGAANVRRSFCNLRLANGTALSILKILGSISVGRFAILLATPFCTVNSQLLACSPKLVLSACCNVLCSASSPTMALQLNRPPLLSIPTISSIGVITSTGAAGATTTGSGAIGSTGGRLLGRINIAQAASASAIIATINKTALTNKSLR